MIVANKNSGDHQFIAGWEKRKSKEQGKSIFALIHPLTNSQDSP